MKLASYYRAQGHEIHFTRSLEPELFEQPYDLVLGSAIFQWSSERIKIMRGYYPQAIICGTGSDDWRTVEQYLGVPEWEQYDYSIYPDFEHSIGFSQRGCRLSCSFCVVPKKEGKVLGLNRLAQIWRGDPYPKKLHLLDNDFFGQPAWQERCDEAISGDYQICLNQGINVRLIHREGAKMLRRMKYRDDQFKTPRVYTAWDNRKDEQVFKRGIGYMLEAEIPPRHILVYMLCGYWPGETLEDCMYRFEEMKKIGLMPYPMIYDKNNKTLRRFQRWVIRRYHEFIPWEDYGKKPTDDSDKTLDGELAMNGAI
jgi:hypothetical protein